MNNITNNRISLLCKISEHEFMMIELGLYLDTHPDCQDALSAFKKHKTAYDELVKLYNNKFGPLTLYQVTSTNYWNWIDTPWPWEMEEC